MNSPGQSNRFDFPLSQPGGRVRRLFNRTLGRLLVRLYPDTARRIECGGEIKTRIDRLIMIGLVVRHKAAGTVDRISHAHSKFWSSEDAVRWHDFADARFERSFLGPHHVAVEELDKILATGHFDTLCEIGCGSGRVLNHVAKRSPHLKEIIGLDLSPDQIAKNRRHFGDPRMKFFAVDARQWVSQNVRPRRAFLTYGGVLEYFSDAELRGLLAQIARKRPACFALVEPLHPDQDLLKDFKPRVFGEELQFSHNYPHVFAEAGSASSGSKSSFTQAIAGSCSLRQRTTCPLRRRRATRHSA